jgi:hypothetical protein
VETGVQDLVSELLKVRPGAARVMMGQHEAFRLHDETPAHEFDSVIKLLDGPRLIELTARDSFDDRLAGFLLDRIAEQALPGLRSGRIRVLSARFPETWAFECIVVVPPTIAGRFEHESSRLRRVTYWVVPAFANEFRDGEGAEAFWYQIGRKDGWNVPVIRWDRCRKAAPTFDR